MSKVLDNPRQAILDAAGEIFYASGYGALTMREVARRSGVALGTIYNYFYSRQELLLDLMSAYWDGFLARAGATAQSELDFYGKLHAVFDDLSGVVGRFREAWLRPELYDAPEVVRDGRQREAGSMERFASIVRELLEREAARPGGQIRLRQSAEDTARFIVMNLIAMLQMPMLDYDRFERFLKDLMQP